MPMMRGPKPPASPTQASQMIELAVFLLLLMPQLVLTLFASPAETLGPIDFATVAGAIIVRDVALVALVAFFLWMSGEARGKAPFACLGWDLRDAPKEMDIGVALFFPMTLSAAVVDALLRAAGLGGPSTPAPVFAPEGALEIALAVVLVVVVAIAEETIFRGYLIHRLRTLSGSQPLAIAASSLLFALGHGYQGPSGLIAIGVIGVFLSLVYVWRKTLVAVTTMHFIQNFIGIVLAPALAEAA